MKEKGLSEIPKDNNTPIPVRKNLELQEKVKKFLGFLYEYDCKGPGAYFKKQKELSSYITLEQNIHYQMRVGRKYLWIDAPLLDLGVTEKGTLFKPKNRSYGRFIGDIDWFLEKGKWGKNIKRVHTSALRSMGFYHGSSLFDYYNLEYHHSSPKNERSDGTSKIPSGTNMLRTSDMIKEMKPVWIKFIVNLGYTEKKGKLFADGYANCLSKLPILGKMYALSFQDDKCMAAGFTAAHINEEQALKRYKKTQEKSKK